MPHRRPIKQGSFGGHFDELVKQFKPSRSNTASPASGQKSKSKIKSAATINQKLFERAAH